MMPAGLPNCRRSRRLSSQARSASSFFESRISDVQSSWREHAAGLARLAKKNLGALRRGLCFAVGAEGVVSSSQAEQRPSRKGRKTVRESVGGELFGAFPDFLRATQRGEGFDLDRAQPQSLWDRRNHGPELGDDLQRLGGPAAGREAFGEPQADLRVARPEQPERAQQLGFLGPLAGGAQSDRGDQQLAFARQLRAPRERPLPFAAGLLVAIAKCQGVGQGGVDQRVVGILGRRGAQARDRRGRVVARRLFEPLGIARPGGCGDRHREPRRSVGIGRDRAGAVQGAGEPECDHGQQRADERHVEPKQAPPAHLFPQPIEPGAAPREHAPPFEVTVQIRGEIGGRGVAIRGFLAQRLGEDRVQIAAQSGRLRLLFADRAVERFGTGVGELVGPPPGEQFVEDDAERVEVRGAFDRLAAHLLGARVGGGHRAVLGLRDVRRPSGLAFEQPRDAEVEQLRLAAFRNQNVSGLQVAVHHRRGMRMLDRAEDLQEQPDPFAG
jgi:hypothetical protein